MGSINFKMWIGVEVEGIDKGTRLYVDGATYEEIKGVLQRYEVIKAIYFGHAVDWNVVRKLYRRIRVIVEVTKITIVPIDIIGQIEIVYRIPNWVSNVKIIRGDSILVFDTETGNCSTNIWGGKKVYDKDKKV